MNTLNVYTELDSLFDSRRATLESLLPSNETWEGVYAKQYKERKMDLFERKELGITQSIYEQAYDKRDLSLFTNIKPTQVLSKLLLLVLDSEQLVGKPIALNVVNITINLYPYDLDEDLVNELEKNIKQALVFKNELTFVSKPPTELDAKYFKNFDNVFKYDILIGKDSKTFMESLAKTPIKDMKFFVPDLYVKQPDNGIVCSPEELVESFSLVLAPALTLLCVRHSVYDYME